MEIERVGNTLVIRPVAAHSLVGVVDRFAAFPAVSWPRARDPRRKRKGLVGDALHARHHHFAAA